MRLGTVNCLFTSLISFRQHELRACGAHKSNSYQEGYLQKMLMYSSQVLGPTFPSNQIDSTPEALEESVNVLSLSALDMFLFLESNDESSSLSDVITGVKTGPSELNFLEGYDLSIVFGEGKCSPVSLPDMDDAVS